VFVIQHGVVVRMPDDVPAPPGSVPVEPPAAFFERPFEFRVDGDRLVERSYEELEEIRTVTDPLKFTEDEVRRLKAALAEGRI
jgi:hypothetical protein